MRALATKFAVLLAALLVSEGAAAVAGAAAGAAREPVHVEVSVFAGGEGVEFFPKVAEEYKEAAPDVRIDIEADPRIADKVRVRILEGSVPDVTDAPFINYYPLIANDQVLPLDAAMDGPNWEHDSTWRQSILPGTLDLYTVDGHVYGVPLNYLANVIWYNKTIFDKHGWMPPRTWEEFFALCRAIKAAGIAPLAFQGRYPYYAGPFYDAAVYHLAGNEALLAQRRLEPGSFDTPASVQAFAWLAQTATYFQRGAMGMSHTESQMEFFSGNTAMIPCGAWLKSEMKGKIPDGFRLGCFNMPVPSQRSAADPTALHTFSLYFFVFNHAKHPEAAINFLRFLTSRRMAGMLSRMQDIPTTIRGASEGNLSGDLDDLVALMHQAKSTYGIDPAQRSPLTPAFQQQWEDELYNVITGKVTPEQAAREIQAAADVAGNRELHPRTVLVRHIWEPSLLLGLLALATIYTLASWVRAAWQTRRDPRRALDAARPRLAWGNVLLFTAPALAFYTLFVVVPSVRSFIWSRYEWNGLGGVGRMAPVGSLNFRRLLFESDVFWIALKNNLFLMFVVPAFVIPLSLFFAACISRGIWGSRLFRIVFFFPNLLGSVAVTLLWEHLYNPRWGLVNALLGGVGLKSFTDYEWLSPDHLYWALIPLSIWAACGFNMILFLAAMQTIPQSLYEAAELDGATPWRQFWTITLPMIWEILCIAIVFLIIGGMKAFEVIWLLTNQRPTSANHVISTRMVRAMFDEFRIGEATAIAVLLFLMVFLGSSVTLRLMKREAIEI